MVDAVDLLEEAKVVMMSEGQCGRRKQAWRHEPKAGGRSTAPLSVIGQLVHRSSASNGDKVTLILLDKLRRSCAPVREATCG